MADQNLLPARKPRNRHSPEQLAALNRLYEEDDHPSLSKRVALAESLGMETKTVNSWFQNKRAASSKKKSSARTSIQDLPTITALVGSSKPSEYEDAFDEPSFLDNARSSTLKAMKQVRSAPDLGHPMHALPSADQEMELRKFFNRNTQPSEYESGIIAEKIGLPHDTVTFWFRDKQTDLDRKQQDLAGPRVRSTPIVPLNLPPASNHPSIANLAGRRRSPSMSSSPIDEISFRRSQSRRSSTPYSTSAPSRSRRSRPEPYQLEALKDLYGKTHTPTIDQRSQLANEIGMDVSKVTNWFRNIRQSTRKKAKKADSDFEDDDDLRDSPSRPGSPSLRSSSSSINNDPMDFDDDSMHHGQIAPSHSSEDEYQEAVTPSPESSPRLRRQKLSRPALITPRSTFALENLTLSIDPSLYPDHDRDQVAVAHFLIDFHDQHVVHT